LALHLQVLESGEQSENQYNIPAGCCACWLCDASRLCKAPHGGDTLLVSPCENFVSVT